MSHLGEKHFANRLDYVQAQADLIQKGLYGGLPCEDLIMKGGEGSKGGKIIGHTKSGKPIYDKANHPGHKNFSFKEHSEAAALNKDLATKWHKGELEHSNHITAHNQHKAAAMEALKNEKPELYVGYNPNEEYHFTSHKGSKYVSNPDEGKGAFIDRVKKQIKEDHGDDVILKAEGDVDDGTFDKAEPSEYNTKIKKVMDEFKAGTLKSSAGEKITDRDQAMAIALSEAKGLKKAMTAAAGEGVTQKESVEHDVKDMQNAKASDLKKAYDILGLGDLIEKAEGSRGGKVIGHTKSGKPIYEEKNLRHYKNFTSQDHKDAADFHVEAHGKIHNSGSFPGTRSAGNQSEEQEAQKKKHRDGMEYHEMHARRAKAAEAGANKREMSNKENSK